MPEKNHFDSSIAYNSRNIALVGKFFGHATSESEGLSNRVQIFYISANSSTGFFPVFLCGFFSLQPYMYIDIYMCVCVMRVGSGR